MIGESFHNITISIHALREEGDAVRPHRRPGPKPFLSTPSARRATPAVPGVHQLYDYFYPRPPRGGRPSLLIFRPSQANFYPRPPRGGRPVEAVGYSDDFEFLSTPSARRATFLPRRKRGNL